MRCTKCGEVNLDNSRFCAFCGHQIQAPPNETYQKPKVITLGTVLKGRYENCAFLGKTWLGGVFKAHDKVQNDYVAIKVIFAETINRYFQSSNFKELFYETLDPYTTISHENLVNVKDLGDHAGEYYLCMEFIEGASLDFILFREKKIDANRVLNFAKQIAKALQFIHHHELYHRDLKPSNIIVTKDDELKLKDLGLVNIRVTSESIITRKGEFLGTPEYVAPEILKGDNFDSRADVFSFGVILYEMLTRFNPFTGKNAVISSQNVMRLNPQPPSVFNNHVTTELDKIILTMLEKDKEARYATAGEVLEDLSNLSIPIKSEIVYDPKTPYPPERQIEKQPERQPERQQDQQPDRQQTRERPRITIRSPLTDKRNKTRKTGPISKTEIYKTPIPGTIRSPIKREVSEPKTDPKGIEPPHKHATPTRPTEFHRNVRMNISKPIVPPSSKPHLDEKEKTIRTSYEEAYEAYCREDYQEALKIYDGLMEQSKHQEETWVGKGMVLLEIAPVHELNDFLDKALMVFPRSIDLKIIRVRSMIKQGKVEEAKERINELSTMTDEEDNLLLMRGDLLLKDEPNEAEQCFKKLMAIHKGDWFVYVQVAKVYLNYGMFEQAKSQFQHALVYNRDNALIHYYLGVTNVSLGNKDKAAEHLEKAIENKPGYKEAENMLKQLK